MLQRLLALKERHRLFLAIFRGPGLLCMSPGSCCNNMAIDAWTSISLPLASLLLMDNGRDLTVGRRRLETYGIFTTETSTEHDNIVWLFANCV